MEFKFDNNTPIYIQLVEQIKINIISGKLSPGERLPSVRELALMTKVNPNTMQKALAELESSGLIYTERTNGKFVTEDSELIGKYRSEYAAEAIQKYLAAMAELGYSRDDAAQFLSREVK
ncbi:MAG: GntR family transcriptional regulator [Clostridia bacterium]|nr:GntR family transcriptional regulator [Clostridia bacterium]